jgi:hypothetical protein
LVAYSSIRQRRAAGDSIATQSSTLKVHVERPDPEIGKRPWSGAGRDALPVQFGQSLGRTVASQVLLAKEVYQWP